MKAPYSAAVAALALVLGACANTSDTDPVRVEQDFGRSVDQMIEAQIYDPKAARKPPAEPPMGLDGVQGEAILKTHREHVGDPKTVDEDVQFDISTDQ
jgi:hypothetical protein